MPKRNEADDQWEFEVFAKQHPHEAYEMDPDRFWEFFHGKCPMVPRLEMVRVLEETNED